MTSDHEHEWTEADRDDNENRIRTYDVCGECGVGRYGCFAKRLDRDGQTAWGPPGEWWYTIGDGAW